MVIVEGADNSGKTTLANAICKKFQYLRVRKGKGPKNDYKFWISGPRESLEDQIRAVWDRFFFSELAYGAVIRKRIRLTAQQKEVIESLLLAADPLIILCSLIDDEGSFNERDQLFTWEQNKEVAAFYPWILEKWNPFIFTPTETPIEKVFECVRNYLKTRKDWLTFRRVCPYGRGNPYSPQLMVVGEKFGPNNPLGIPMERSKTGIMVHNALRENNLTMSDVWITNAIKYPGELNNKNLIELAAENELIKPEGIVALGKRASGILSTLRIPHVRVNHPGYYMRIGRKEVFQSDFKAAIKQLRRRNE